MGHHYLVLQDHEPWGIAVENGYLAQAHEEVYDKLHNTKIRLRKFVLAHSALFEIEMKIAQTAAHRKTPSCKGLGISLFYNPKKAFHRSTGVSPALLLMRISPTDAHEEEPFWPFRHMKREPGSFRHAQVQAFGTISGPFPHRHETLLRGFGHRVTVRTLTQTTIRGLGNQPYCQTIGSGIHV